MNEDGRSSNVERLESLSLSEGDRTKQRARAAVLDKPTSSTASEASGSCGDGDSDSSSGGSGPARKAPVELLGEFLLYVRQGNWEDAKKLCKMILIYEPDNPEANSFLPLIEEKMQIDKELAAISEEEGSSRDGGDSSSVASYSTGAEDEENKNDDGDDDDDESDFDSDEDSGKTEHLKNKLVFLHKDGESSKIWKP